jgi:hypothetical protein
LLNGRCELSSAFAVGHIHGLKNTDSSKFPSSSSSTK